MRIITALLLLPLLASGNDSTRGELDWLAGCWIAADKSSQEVWVVESDNSLLGFSVALEGGAVGFYEILSIRQDDAGAWVYTAYPSGQASASFVATAVSDSAVVFLNPDHDYPQEIRYRRDGSRLVATISLRGGDKPTSFDKVACE